MSRSQAHREAGIALITAIFIAVLLAIVIGVIVTSQMSAVGDSRRHNARSSSMDVASSSVQALQQALVAARSGDAPANVSQSDGFVIKEADLLAASNAASQGPPIDTSTAKYPDVDHSLGGLSKTMLGPVTTTDQGEQRRRLWQVVQALAPTGTFPWLTLYVRGWTETNGVASDAAVVKARLKPGSLADYQLLSDAPVMLDDNATINGRVHSNGGIDEWLRPPFNKDANLRVWASGPGPVACKETAGVEPVVSTASGNIDLGASTCTIEQGNGVYVPLDVARDAVFAMRKRCAVGADDVRCINTGGPVDVTIQSNGVTIVPGGFVPVPSSSTKAIVFDHDVRVHGTTSARLTIAAWSKTGGVAAPSITIVGDIGRENPTPDAPRALGLLAENDIIVDPSPGAPPTLIQAALFASTGGVRLPWRYRMPLPDSTWPAAQRAQLEILGSVVSHTSIALRWSLDDDWVGFDQRTYKWDPMLNVYAPPFWPSTNPWELVDQSEASGDCYGASASKKGTPACR